mgnify:CR=1 FL=1
MDYTRYLMTVKTWNENGEVVFYKDVSRIYKDGEYFVLENVYGETHRVHLKDDNILEVS